MQSLYQNPILFADYSDPDVIRVGDTFYMTASSFNYTPGLPILISTDLVNWKLVNYALDNIGQGRYRIPRHSEGVWAPAIRYHEGVFHIYYGMPDEGYYVVRTKDPLGKWDEPVCVLEGKGLIDPCPFWDEDGRAYIIHGYAKSRIGFKSILGIFEMNTEGTKAISEDHFIFDGNDPAHPAITIEGPKVYKRNGYYYILAPAGGVKHGWQVALRSKNIHGPYEIRTVMEQGNTVINGPHQGGLVDTATGSEWFIHFQDRGLYGRICHLQPVRWINDWPVIGKVPDTACSEEKAVGTCGEPVEKYIYPVVRFRADEDEQQKGISYNRSESVNIDSFENGSPDLSWQWMGDHRDDFFGKVSDETGGVNGGIRLFSLNPSGDDDPVIWRSANVLTQKIRYPVFRSEISLDASGLENGERAGVCMMGGQYVTAFIRKDEGEYSILVAQSEGGDSDKKETITKRWNLKELCRGYNLSIDECVKDLKFVMSFTYRDREFDSEELYFRNVEEPMFGENPGLYIDLEIGGNTMDLGVKFTPSDHTWVGAKIGIYALSGTCGGKQGSGAGNAHSAGYADFKNVIIREL